MEFRAANRKTCRGFSLIELMVVLLLIAVLSAMIIPAMHGTYEDALLRSTARRLVDVCNLANSRALTLNQAFYVRLNTREGKYLIEPQRKASAVANQFAPFEGVFDQRISIEFRRPEASVADVAGAENERDLSQIMFYPDGTADARELLLRDRHGVQLALRINPVTARVQILEIPRE